MKNSKTLNIVSYVLLGATLLCMVATLVMFILSGNVQLSDAITASTGKTQSEITVMFTTIGLVCLGAAIVLLIVYAVLSHLAKKSEKTDSPAEADPSTKAD